jgi:acetoin utilization deacetylase AcuC-like enzyme
MIIIIDESCADYHSEGHPEAPSRITRTLESLRRQKEIPVTWEKPVKVEESMLLRAHSPAHLARLQQPEDFDADTPAYPNIFHHACQSVGGALRSLSFAKQEGSFSLLRPPGHHAERGRAMGFCYLNQIAIAALHALTIGYKKVAVFDFDVHHGNGTENILMGHPSCALFSVHQYPCYPGTGQKTIANCHNYPVIPNAPREAYRSILSQAIDDLKKFKPDLIAVSAGFDAYRGDPLSEELLEIEDFHWIGESIRKTSIPYFCVLEGGYSQDLSKLIQAFFRGLEGL